MKKNYVDLRSFFSKFKNKEEVDGGVLAEALDLLASREVEPGGPYWDYSAKGEKQVNLGANKEIAEFLSFFDVELEPLQEYLEAQGGSKGTRKKTADKPSVATSSARGFGRSKKAMAGKEEGALKEITKTAEKMFSGLDRDLKRFALEAMGKTLRANKDHQMPLMPYYFKLALGKKGKKISDKLIYEMGVMNILFWTAFIIYDDFWDEDESADPRILPTANLYSRNFILFFNELFPKDKVFKKFFSDMMDSLDAANTWETTHRRTKVVGDKVDIPAKLPNYGDYTQAYQPASAHILGPVAMMRLIGYSEKSKEMKLLISYFKNYLISMQFNDDLHDWEEDLGRGHLSSAVIRLMKVLKKKKPNKKKINLKKDKDMLQEFFWFDVLPKACKEGIKFSKKSRQALESLKIIENSAYLEKFINLPENALQEALDEHKISEEFLKAYGKK